MVAGSPLEKETTMPLAASSCASCASVSAPPGLSRHRLMTSSLAEPTTFSKLVNRRPVPL